MRIDKKEYKNRLIDKKIKETFSVFDCVLIEGPKWCGKTWTALNTSNSHILLSDPKKRNEIQLKPEKIFNYQKNQSPILIDEWQNVPELWDLIRNYIDLENEDLKFILTGSSSFNRIKEQSKIFHSGTGRIASLKMNCLSLYESGDSDGKVSLMDLYNKIDLDIKTRSLDIEELASLIIRGGWPQIFHMEDDSNFSLLPKKYIDSLINHDIKEFGNKNKKIANMILKSLARNESTIVSNNTLTSDVFDYQNDQEVMLAKNTVSSYLNVFRDLHILVEDDAFDINYRSSKKVGKSPKRHLVDPSLSCALLNLNETKLVNDLNTFGFMFEALVERDLRTYAEYLNGSLYHFRDNSSGLEIDSVIEFEDGEYGIFEIKLGMNSLDEAIKAINTFRKNVQRKPKFACVIIGLIDFGLYNKENDVYIFPIHSLKP